LSEIPQEDNKTGLIFGGFPKNREVKRENACGFREIEVSGCRAAGS